MFDYFKIDSGWPGYSDVQPGDSAMEKAGKLENKTLLEIKKSFPRHNIEKRFIPFIQIHEFESLLFSDPSILAGKIGIKPIAIEDILRECGEPEEINDYPVTAPSKRIEKLCRKKYRKVAMGKSIAESIGVQTMRRKCPHFDKWLNSIELLVN